MYKCMIEAQEMNEDLFPVDCIEILENNYKMRLENMKPITIYNKVCDMMAVLIEVDDDAKRHVIENVNWYVG